MEEKVEKVRHRNFPFLKIKLFFMNILKWKNETIFHERIKYNLKEMKKDKISEILNS